MDDFYLGIEQGVKFVDWVYEHPGVVLINSSGNFSCPASHTKEYCAGWNFGDAWEVSYETIRYTSSNSYTCDVLLPRFGDSNDSSCSVVKIA
jgi:hypothetical protein